MERAHRLQLTAYAKPRVERTIGYLETSFLPARSFGSIADFNRQLGAWLPRANGRQHRIIGCRPADRIAEDRVAMLPLPPVLPDPAFRTATRLPRDHYVRVLGSDYSVHPRAMGRRVDVRVDLEVVRITLAGDLVGQHRRSLLPHQVLTDPAHVLARAYLRDERRSLEASGAEPDVEVRDLAVYDRLVEAVS